MVLLLRTLHGPDRLLRGLVVDGILVQTESLLLILDHLGDDLEYLIVVGPLIGHQLRGKQYVVHIDLKGAYSREDDLLCRILVHKHILLGRNFRCLDQLIGDGILDDDGIGDELLNLALDCIRGELRSLNCSKYFHSECRAKLWWVSQF